MLQIRRLFLLLSIISFTVHDADIQHAESDVKITVFIHGAVTLGPMTPVTHFDLFMFDKVSGSLYEKIIRSVRSDAFLFENQAMKETGLCEIDLENVKPGCAAEAFSSIFDRLSNYAGRKNTFSKYYTYGWAGAFSKQCRRECARQLYDALLTECAHLRKQGLNPIVTLVGYCHGAQLILELGSIAKKYGVDIPLVINESVLIGMPTSPDDASFVESPIFKKVDLIFSENDRVQPIDLFVGKKLWNRRTIPTDNPTVRKKLTQINLRVYKPFGSRQKNSIDFFKEEVALVSRKLWRNQSPGHIELWFFYWTPSNYRKDWILSPFPAAAFLPVILQYADKARSSFADDQPIIVDIRPHAGKVFVRQIGSSIIKKEDWIPSELLEELKTIASSAKPSKRRTKKEYTERINLHVQKISCPVAA